MLKSTGVFNLSTIMVTLYGHMSERRSLDELPNQEKIEQARTTFSKSVSDHGFWRGRS
jgi:hypothetical protein